MKISLIFDGHYLMHRIIYPLHSQNMLYGAFKEVLVANVERHLKEYPYHQIWFASDSEGSWRKNVYPKYKSNRERNSEIDWNFIKSTFDEFMSEINEHNNLEIVESPGIEGDDWIAQIVNANNKNGISNVIVSGDSDLNQLLIYDKPSEIINIQLKDNIGKEKVFLPSGYRLFLNKIRDKEIDLFELDWRYDFLNYMEKIEKDYEVKEINSTTSLLQKLIQGDKSDKIQSVFETFTSTGKVRGVGEAGSKKIMTNVLEELGGIVDVEDPDVERTVFENVLSYKKTKIEKKNIKIVQENYERNKRLIYLHEKNLPTQYRKIIKQKIDEKIKL